MVIYRSDDIILQINIINVRFLKNGAPTLRLPENIANHKDFKHLFGALILDVDPCKKKNNYKTKYRSVSFFFL